MAARRKRASSAKPANRAALADRAAPSAPAATRPFLTAEWRQLAMLNFEIDPALLTSLVPRGTQLDQYHGRAYLSVVGFLFTDVRLLGMSIPRHRDFPEVNLRFYVRREVHRKWRRGVVFVKEICPRWCVSAIARRFFHERYETRSMRYELQLADGSINEGGEASYEWRQSGRWHQLSVQTAGLAQLAADGSVEEFITENYWGYTRDQHGETIEYEVKHPRWRVWKAPRFTWDCDVEAVYGSSFVEPLSQAPTSALLAEGSEIEIHRGRRLPASP